MTTIALTGDVMLGRLVNQAVICNPGIPPEALWGDVLPLLLEADVRVANLECVISDRGSPWQPQSKAFHFRASPRATEFLRVAKIECVTLANNHVLDYGVDALTDCMALLDREGISHVGAGLCLQQAMTPAFFPVPGLSVAVVGLSDNEPEWEATETRPGINFVAYGAHGMIEPYRSRLARSISDAKQHAAFVLVGAHVGPNWGPPSQAIRALACELIDLGADCYWGHSNHAPQGIEVYRGKPILYAAGDFVDDYAVEPTERNDLSFLYLLDVDGADVTGLRLIPTAIENFRARRARSAEQVFLQRTMQRKCAEFGTSVVIREGRGSLSIRLR